MGPVNLSYCNSSRARERRQSGGAALDLRDRLAPAPRRIGCCRHDPEFELDELAEIYVKRGVDRDLARQVARQLMAKDALSAHAHDELGISEITTARPVQAALTSAVSFSIGAAMPLLMVVVSPASVLVPIVFAASLGFLAFLGAIGAESAAQTFCAA